jgi:peptidyl-dipeptidase Dcp
VVKDGIFYLANQLYDIHFTEMTDAPKYNPEVTVYDVTDADGKHLSVFMTDYYPRAGKAQGAWMSAFKEEYNYEEAGERPIIYNVGNLTKPTKDTPSLLTMDETCTVFHEFGHALQGMLTTAEYRGQNGTSVDRDIVEMPSQINEHWAMEPEILKHYARHYKTGEVIPDSLINKLLAAGTFNQGFMTTELVGAALLDLEWHTAEMGDSDVDVMAFERSIAEKWGLPHEVQFRYRSPYFKHIFGSSHYASGYYTYLWAEVLEADGYETFREHGILDKATAKSYRENILEPGDSEDPMVLFTRFRGKAPSVDALLKNRGLK